MLPVGISSGGAVCALFSSTVSTVFTSSAVIALSRLRGSLPARAGRGAVSATTAGFRGASSTTTAAEFSARVELSSLGADFRGALRSRLGCRLLLASSCSEGWRSSGSTTSKLSSPWSIRLMLWDPRLDSPSLRGFLSSRFLSSLRLSSRRGLRRPVLSSASPEEASG